MDQSGEPGRTGEDEGYHLKSLAIAGISVGLLVHTLFNRIHGDAPVFLAVPMTLGAAVVLDEFERSDKPRRLGGLLILVLIAIMLKDFVQDPQEILSGYFTNGIKTSEDFQPILPAAISCAPFVVMVVLASFVGAGDPPAGGWRSMRTRLLVPLAAAAILSDARIDEQRVPATHPELIPGLALAAPDTPADLRTALGELCQEVGEGVSLSMASGQHWRDVGWSAHTLLFTRTETRGCALYRRTLTVSVALADTVAPRYRLMSRAPVTRTPIGECPDSPIWREEKLLAGGDGPVRVLITREYDGESMTHSSVRARRVSPVGWTEQLLLEPAPQRLAEGGPGPLVELAESVDPPWIVVHGYRTGDPPDCRSQGGQTVWIPQEDGSWVPHTGREALALLASQGLWRLAGDDGWMLVLWVLEESQADRADTRARRYARKLPAGEDVQILSSSLFPSLNPGFLVLAPAPWPHEAEARAALEGCRQFIMRSGKAAPMRRQGERCSFAGIDARGQDVIFAAEGPRLAGVLGVTDLRECVELLDALLR